MKTKNTSWKTTLIGVICLINVIVSLVLVYIKIATLTDVGIYLGISTPIIVSIKTLFEKDADKTGLPN